MRTGQKEQRAGWEQPLAVRTSTSWPSWWGKIAVESTVGFEARPAPHAWMVGSVWGWEKPAAFTGASSVFPDPVSPSCQTGPRCGILDMAAERAAGLCRIKAEDRSAVHVAARPRSSSVRCQSGFHSYFTGKLQVSSVSLFSDSHRITLS